MMMRFEFEFDLNLYFLLWFHFVSALSTEIAILSLSLSLTRTLDKHNLIHKIITTIMQIINFHCSSAVCASFREPVRNPH